MFGWELRVASLATVGATRPRLWRGTPASGEEYGLWGRKRYMSSDLAEYGREITFDARLDDGSSFKACLGEIRYTALVMPQAALDVVTEDGSRLRFRGEPDGLGGTDWDPAPGIRDALTGDAASGYTLTRANGWTYEFGYDKDGAQYLETISDPQGRSLLLSYDLSTDRLKSVEDDSPVLVGGASFTPKLTFTYDGNGYLDTVTDWSARRAPLCGHVSLDEQEARGGAGATAPSRDRVDR